MKNFIKHLRSRVTLGLPAFLVAGGAMAQSSGGSGTDLGTAASTAISGAGPQVTAVVTSILTVLVILVVWSLIKRAMGK